MYEAFYGLRERPFNLTPDPRYLYLSEKHKEAFAHLLYGIKNRSGFVMITGEIGTGKTTICRNLLNQLDEHTEVAFIFNPSLNVVELLERIHSEFGIESKAQNALGLVDELNTYLLEKAAEGKNCVLVIDEAQNLSPQVLEQIRLLSNLETERDKLLQIILIGQPELGEMLQLHELRQLNQRITARYHLKPLSHRETLQYIAYRLHVAGAKRRVKFDKAAIRAVYRYSGGTPRVINALCDRALLIGYTRENYEITKSLIKQAAKEIKGERHKSRKAGSLSGGLAWLVPNSTVVFAVIITLALAVFFAQPLERFTREFSAFNSIVSTGLPAEADVAASQAASPTPASGAVAQAAANGPVSTVLMEIAEKSRVRPAEAMPPEAPEAPLDPAIARAAAVTAILNAWDRDTSGLLPADDSVAALGAFLDAQELANESLRASLDALLAINLPFFAQMKRDEATWWTAVVAVSGDSLTISSDGTANRSLPREQFEEWYTGEAVVPWEDETPQARVLKPNMSSEEVAAFRQRLHRIGRLEAADGNNYDAATQAAVRGLQEETGLPVDGIAGRQVRMVLASWLDDESPSLQERPLPPPAQVAEHAAPAAPAAAPRTARAARSGQPEKKAAAPSAAAIAPDTEAAAPVAPDEHAAVADAGEADVAPAQESASPSDAPDPAPAAEALLAEETVPEEPRRPMFWLGANPSEPASGQFGGLQGDSGGADATVPAGAADGSLPPASQPPQSRKRSTAPVLSGVPLVPSDAHEPTDQS